MIIAHTIKGKGVSFVENRDGRHGIALSETDLQRALDELGSVDDQRRWTYSLS
jgi:transketolase